MRINKINREEYHEQHLLISKELDTEFKEVISKYNSFGTKTQNKSFDKTTKSELIRMMIHNLVIEFNSNPNAALELLAKLSDFREKGAGAKL